MGTTSQLGWGQWDILHKSDEILKNNEWRRKKGTSQWCWCTKSNGKTKTGKIIKGDFSFGGVLSTAGNLLFATGTPDKYLRAYESNSGKKLWEYKLPAAGSSSPITYLYNDEQYILVNSGGGKFFGFEEKLGDQIIAFKLN